MHSPRPILCKRKLIKLQFQGLVQADRISRSMAELAVFSLASKVLSAVASPALTAAYEKGCSIWDAKDDLNKLRVTIGTIRAVLLDAEKKQESSDGVKNWIKRVKGVLYDADDLFDEVATDDMLKRQIAKLNPVKKHLKKVRVFFSKLNPVVSNNSVAKRVKAIRKTLLEISIDMKVFGFVESLSDQPISRGLQDPGCFVDSYDVIGRDEDKNAVLEMLAYEQSNNARKYVSVVAVVGIGGMGKSTLAQLLYNDEEVRSMFPERWFACISDTVDNKEIVGKIFQSICKQRPTGLDVGELQTNIMSSVEGKKFLLVLDDVWDDNRGNWIDRLRLLGGGAKGSKIIVTTRNLSVAEAMGASKTTTRNLDGLHEEDSWKLFKRIAFTTPEQENDLRRNDLGRKIMKKCANLPLAIKSIGSLLRIKSTIVEWESVSKKEFLRIGQNDPNSILSILKFSYDHLNSNLKQCFAYCSLFPKDHVIYKWDLIHLWMAQGYIRSDNETHTDEEIGHSYFMDLVRRSFFQEMGEDGLGEHCKMHDLIHDLAQQVAGEEIVMLTGSSYGVNVARHVSVGGDIDGSWEFAPIMIRNGHQLHSFIFFKRFVFGRLILSEELENGKYLRALSLPGVGIENIPTSIGELKHLRYLDISHNHFKSLPDPLTKLLNLCTLNITRCAFLETLPNDFRKLINLRHLKNKRCLKLKYMPPGFEELTSLQCLDEFKVGGGGSSVLGLKGHRLLSGKLFINFALDVTSDGWDEVEYWLPPVNLQWLEIRMYSGTKIPKWSNGRTDNQLPSLTGLQLSDCSRVECLPPFRHLPNLKSLVLKYMYELKYIQEDDRATESDSLFLPPLEKLELYWLPELEGWWGKVGGATNMDESESMEEGHLLHSFPSLSCLEITWCPEIKWMPLCPCLVRLKLEDVDTKLISQLLLPPSPSITTSSSLKYLHISFCDTPTSLPGESLTSLSTLVIGWCLNLMDVVLVPSRFNFLEELTIWDCNKLKLWDEEKRGVDWDSLPNLRTLKLDKVPPPERLPNCLRDREASGKLEISAVEN